MAMESFVVTVPQMDNDSAKISVKVPSTGEKLKLTVPKGVPVGAKLHLSRAVKGAPWKCTAAWEKNLPGEKKVAASTTDPSSTSTAAPSPEDLINQLREQAEQQEQLREQSLAFDPAPRHRRASPLSRSGDSLNASHTTWGGVRSRSTGNNNVPPRGTTPNGTSTPARPNPPVIDVCNPMAPFADLKESFRTNHRELRAPPGLRCRSPSCDTTALSAAGRKFMSCRAGFKVLPASRTMTQRCVNPAAIRRSPDSSPQTSPLTMTRRVRLGGPRPSLPARPTALPVFKNNISMIPAIKPIALPPRNPPLGAMY